METSQLEPLIAAVERALADTEAEYAQMPFFVRPLVRRGFVKRTGHDFARWRELLAGVRRGQRDVASALAALAEHYRGAPERAKRGMGGSATPAEVALVEERSRARAEAAAALRAAVM